MNTTNAVTSTTKVSDMTPEQISAYLRGETPRVFEVSPEAVHGQPSGDSFV